MKLLLTGIILFVCMHSSLLNAQDKNHKWNPLIVNDTKKVWVDEACLDTVKGDKFEVWLLQMHVPPLKFDGIKGDIYRSQTLFAVDLTSVKYGIEKVVYYDAANKEIYSFDYKIKTYEDNLKYTYPVLENSSIHLVIKELYKNKAENKQ